MSIARNDAKGSHLIHSTVGKILLIVGVGIVASSPAHAQWTVQESTTKARLRGLSVVSDDVAWASGTEGTVIRTVDGGKNWRKQPVPDAELLDFRDIHAIDSKLAYVLSIGEGEKSRIFKTLDGGATWTLQYTNRDPRGFLDAIAFWDADHGLVLGDPVDGRYTILTTDDGGLHWSPGKADGMPPALANEGAFAASGTCLVVQGKTHAWFATGGGKTARVFSSNDRGQTWRVHDTTVRAGNPSSGIFSLNFWDANRGVAVGGDYKNPDRLEALVSLTLDAGLTWHPPKSPSLSGYRSGVTALPSTVGPTLIAVGPTGSDISLDGGETWKAFGTLGFHAVAAASPAAVWAVGENGLVSKGEIIPPPR